MPGIVVERREQIRVVAPIVEAGQAASRVGAVGNGVGDTGVRTECRRGDERRDRPATPSPYSLKQRQRKKRTGSKGIWGASLRKAFQSMVSGDAS